MTYIKIQYNTILCKFLNQGTMGSISQFWHLWHASFKHDKNAKTCKHDNFNENSTFSGSKLFGHGDLTKLGQTTWYQCKFYDQQENWTDLVFAQNFGKYNFCNSSDWNSSWKLLIILEKSTFTMFTLNTLSQETCSKVFDLMASKSNTSQVICKKLLTHY